MNLLIGIIVGFLYSYIALPSTEKKNPKLAITIYPIIYNGMVMIPIGNSCIFHIHHWMVYSSLLLFYQYLNDIIIGFSIVLTLHGLTYNDAFDFIEDLPDDYQ